MQFMWFILCVNFIFYIGCCIYEKPREFGESSSSDSDDECEHCKGHVEKKRKKRAQPGPGTNEVVPETVVTVTEPSEPPKPEEPPKEEE